MDRVLYLNRVALAHRAAGAADYPLANEVLDACPPHRRGWEWHYLKRLAHRELHTCLGHTNGVWDVCFSPDGSRLASAGADGTVKVWDAEIGEMALALKGYTRIVSGVRAVSFSPDGTRLASTSAGSHLTTGRAWGEVIVWDGSGFRGMRP